VAKRYPGASFELLGTQAESRMTSHDIICVHTMVGTLAGTDAMFEHDGFGGTESHFGTGGDGACIQWQDLAYSADANLDGWARIISIENADMGAPFPTWGGSDVPRFSEPQADRLTDLLRWLCSVEAHADCPASWTCHREGIPAQFIPDSKPGRRGIGVHRQGCDGNFPAPPSIYAGRVPGGEKWSSALGKVCPGDRRIDQLVNEIIPNLQEDDMPAYTEWSKKDRDALAADVAKAAANADLGDERIANPTDDGPASRSLAVILWTILKLLRKVAKKVGAE
jgi:hypothetical protein